LKKGGYADIMNEFNEAVGRRIRETREMRGVKKEWLAEHLDITNKHLYDVETGRKGISLERLHILSDLLCVSIDYLVSGRRNDRGYDSITELFDALNNDELIRIEKILRAIIGLYKSSDAEYANV